MREDGRNAWQRLEAQGCEHVVITQYHVRDGSHDCFGAGCLGAGVVGHEPRIAACSPPLAAVEAHSSHAHHTTVAQPWWRVRGRRRWRLRPHSRRRSQPSMCTNIRSSPSATTRCPCSAEMSDERGGGTNADAGGVKSSAARMARGLVVVMVPGTTAVKVILAPVPAVGGVRADVGGLRCGAADGAGAAAAAASVDWSSTCARPPRSWWSPRRRSGGWTRRCPS